jgi:minor extracellular serine protease Vpr
VRLPVRRLVVLACLAVTVVLGGSAAAALQPLPRQLSFPLVRKGPVRTLPRPATGRTTVIVTLVLPPLAAARPDRGPFGTLGRRKINVVSASSRAYLARIAATQNRAIASLQRAIPSAHVRRRYRILLNGFAATLPATELPHLLRLGFVNRVYPSLSYRLSMNRGPGVIGAPAFQALTGAKGAGVKVAVVDDGVDTKHPFLSADGFSYPPGFPKGTRGFTTPKVIAARAFFGENSTSEARQPLDESQSFHGTFVAGVIAGAANTTAPASTATCVVASGGCHPAVSGLSGVAPRAWLGNYRVFSAQDPFGNCCSANTPEIVAAFESAVADGMDIINFSGGGTQSDPSTDALIAAVANVAKAGVVPVISAGNDRDLFGLGTVGSPSTAPDAISVAATANQHIFGNALEMRSPAMAGPPIALVPSAGGVPTLWGQEDQQLRDVGTVTGTDGRPVDRTLCSGQTSTLPAGSLAGAIALVTRGTCAFSLQAGRTAQAGARGMVLADNRAGDPTPLFVVSLPGGTVSDIDGARLRDAMAATGGRASIRVNRNIVEIPTPGAVPTSFSSGGPTAFAHQLKPDISAPGASIISSTLVEFAGDAYAVLDGTSFSAPHVAGAAALLLERHPSWTPKQMKSALMTTAGPVFDDAARTREAPVTLEGAGLARVSAADNPLIFTEPQSLSFGDLSVLSGGVSRPLLLSVSDAGGGGGTWQVEVRPQSASPGATLQMPAALVVPPAGQAMLQVTASAPGGAEPGDNLGFLVLRQGDQVRRVPYAFFVSRPRLAGAEVLPLRPVQTGDTRVGSDRVRVYRWPTAPFGVIGFFGFDQTVPEDGNEKVYAIDVKERAVNIGVVVTRPRLNLRASIQSLFYANAPIQPWLLGSLNEDDLQGFAATPVNVNGSMPDFLFSIGAAGATLVPPGRYYFVVDSGRDPFTGKSLAGPYRLRSWVNDVKPPRIKVLSTRVGAGRPTIAVRITDALSGVDPLSLIVSLKNTQIGPLSFDPATGVALFSVPKEATRLDAGPAFMRVIASDYQESKNVNTEGTNPLPNTTFEGVRVDVVNRPAVTWLAPNRNACVSRTARLEIVASSPAPISSVGFFDGTRQIARVKKNVAGVYRVTWRTAKVRRGRHTLTAVASDTAGRESRSTRSLRVCK